MMGADAPTPPVVMNGRRPEGRPAAASITCTRIRMQSLAQARPDEASRRLPASAGRGGHPRRKFSGKIDISNLPSGKILRRPRAFSLNAERGWPYPILPNGFVLPGAGRDARRMYVVGGPLLKMGERGWPGGDS